MTDSNATVKPWHGGNKIPESVLNHFALRGSEPEGDRPDDEALARFLEENL